MSVGPELRDGAIYQAQQQRMARDTKIMQKVGAVNREAFVQRFPGQLEHCMRLVSERLQVLLSKPPGTDLEQVETWLGSPADIEHLSQSLHHLDQIRLNWPVTTQDQ